MPKVIPHENFNREESLGALVPEVFRQKDLLAPIEPVCGMTNMKMDGLPHAEKKSPRLLEGCKILIPYPPTSQQGVEVSVAQGYHAEPANHVKVAKGTLGPLHMGFVKVNGFTESFPLLCSGLENRSVEQGPKNPAAPAEEPPEAAKNAFVPPHEAGFDKGGVHLRIVTG
jgi:hypothetical protein